jgi:peptide/nickel transport system permease protein
MSHIPVIVSTVDEDAAREAERQKDAEASHGRRRHFEFLHFALHNRKLMGAATVELIFILAAIFGPLFTKYGSAQTVSPTVLQPGLHPSWAHPLGTTGIPGTSGNDMLSLMLYSLRETYLVGFLGAFFGALVGLVLGFSAGWRGGLVDEILQMFTNIFIMLPALVLLIVIGSYIKVHTALLEGVFIGCTTWPWVARAVRAQTFTLRTRDFVDLARLSGKRGPSIVMKDIAPNMASYLFLVFILLFAGAMLISVSYDFLGLGPTNTPSLGLLLFWATDNSALTFHLWWWFVPPGAAMTIMVAAAYIANVGLDEVFNPKLRDM